jgi:hypothetical protein
VKKGGLAVMAKFLFSGTCGRTCINAAVEIFAVQKLISERSEKFAALKKWGPQNLISL